MTIVLYNVADDDLKVNKTLGTAIATFSNINLLSSDEEINNPFFEITLDASYLSINYAYIEAWHRYYFVDISITNGNVIRFTLHVDRLMSFINPNKSSLTGYVERNERRFNANIVDEQGIFTNDRDIKTVAVTVNGLTKPIENWKLIGVFNAGLCETIEEVTP